MSSNEHSLTENREPRSSLRRRLLQLGRIRLARPATSISTGGILTGPGWRIGLLLVLAVVLTAGATSPLRQAEALAPGTTNADEDGSGDVSLGDTLTYEITAHNTGGVTLTNVVVSDSLSGTSTVCASVAPGGTCVLTVHYVVKQADVDAGTISTSATADSDQTSAVQLPAPASVGVPSPRLSLGKPTATNADEDSSGSVSQGNTLTYTITATNTGSANLTNVLVSDSLTGHQTTCPKIGPGATCVLTTSHVVSQADVAAGQFTTNYSAESTQTGPVSGSAAVAVPRTALSIDNVAPVTTDKDGSGNLSAGDTLTYTVTATNTGDANLTNVVVSDSLVTQTGGTTPCALLAPGATCTLVGTYTITQADVDAGEVSNPVSAQSTQTAAVTDTIKLDVPRAPSVSITRTGTLDTGPDGVANPGDVIHFSFRVENTGNVTLSDVTVNAEASGAPICVIGTMAPGDVDTTHCARDYTLTQADIDAGHVEDVALAQGSAPTGVVTGKTEDTSGLEIPQKIALDVTRVITSNADEDGSNGVSEGDSLTFSVTATNLGNVVLTNVKVGDGLTGDEHACETLAPSGTCLLLESHTVTSEDVSSGGVANLAYATSDQTGEVRPTQPIAEVASARLVHPSNFLIETPGLSAVSKNVGVVGTNFTLALLALCTLLAATTVFNSTLEENAKEVEAVVKRVSGSPQVAPILAALGWMAAEEAGGESKSVHLLKPALIVLVTAFIYALLDPGFGFNDDTLIVIAALIAGIAMSTFLYEGGQVLWATKRYATPAAMRLYPVAILIALLCVGLTRVTNLHPGIIFGFVTAAAIFPRGELSRRADGLIIAVPLFALMLVSLVAFLLVDPLNNFSNDHPGVLASLPASVAVALFVGGAESALLTLIPVTFNDGEKIWKWSKVVWFAMAIPSAFAFFHVIVNEEDFGQLVSDTGAMTLVIICLVVLAITTVTWLFFKLREDEHEHHEVAHE